MSGQVISKNTTFIWSHQSMPIKMRYYRPRTYYETGGYIFTLSVHTWAGGGGGGGGTPARSRWGYPGQVQTVGGGYPSQVQMGGGGTPAWSGWGGYPLAGMGYPPARSGQGYPPPAGMGYPPSQVRMGWGGVPPGTDGVPPPNTRQQMEYLIRRGRCASCVHAGGLSCLPNFSRIHSSTTIYWWPNYWFEWCHFMDFWLLLGTLDNYPARVGTPQPG